MKSRKAIIFGIKGTKLTTGERYLLKKCKPWGIILFSRNIIEINQLKKLINDLKKVINDDKLPILIDEEGGRVSRLSKIMDFSLFSQNYFYKIYKKDKNLFLTYYKVYVEAVCNILNYVGININTVPVLDLIRKNTHQIIGDRSFSKNSREASLFGNTCIDFYSKNKIATVIKHIPGHGLAKVDSHHSTPFVSKKLDYLTKNDFIPFKNKQSLFAMTAHIVFTDIDNKNTVTHSQKLIKLIRNRIGFKNILISDDLSMKSLKGPIKENTIKTFKAGCNIVLHCNGNLKEMTVVGQNSPLVDRFITKKTSEFYKILS